MSGIVLSKDKRSELIAKVYKKVLGLTDLELIGEINHLGCPLDLNEKAFFKVLPLVMGRAQ